LLYTAFIADIINSKVLSKGDRERVQLSIKECLSTLNSIFQTSLEFYVIFSAGDEVQGLFKSPEAAFLYSRLFKIILSPLQIRCGLGVGEWTVQIAEGTSSEQDGSAYHNARAAILHAQNCDNYSILFKSDSENDIYINTLISNSLLISKQQSPYQSQVFSIIELINPLYDSKAMNLLFFVQLTAIIKNKLEFANEISSDFEPFDLLSPLLLESKFEFTTTIIKGISKKLSTITNTSRQNIDNIINVGNFNEMRNIDITTYLLIYKTFAR